MTIELSVFIRPERRALPTLVMPWLLAQYHQSIQEYGTGTELQLLNSTRAAMDSFEEESLLILKGKNLRFVVSMNDGEFPDLLSGTATSEHLAADLIVIFRKLSTEWASELIYAELLSGSEEPRLLGRLNTCIPYPLAWLMFLGREFVSRHNRDKLAALPTTQSRSCGDGWLIQSTASLAPTPASVNRKVKDFMGDEHFKLTRPPRRKPGELFKPK